MNQALLLDDNLLSSTKVAGGLQALGFQVQTRRNLPEEVEPPQLVMINLGSRSLGAIGLISACRERFPVARVVGFCGHLEVEIRRAAKASGIHRILTNEQAIARLAEVLGAVEDGVVEP